MEDKIRKIIYKKLLNEIGPEFASIALKNTLGAKDEKSTRIQRDVVVSLFSQYINRNLKLFAQSNKNSASVDFRLIDVLINENGEKLTLDFYNEEGSKDKEAEAPYHPNKRQLEIIYDINSDYYNSVTHSYFFNENFAKFLVYAANLYRSLFFKIYPVIEYFTEDGEKIDIENVKFDENKRPFLLNRGSSRINLLEKINQEETTQMKKSKLTMENFKLIK